MAKKPCGTCRRIRLVLLSVLLGGGAGFGVLAYGGSPEMSMVATFFAALAPILWDARRHRIRHEDSP